ncbi:protein CUSTOS [Xenopus laevis]|uniref:Protein CUSTOS n=2 Tax=Xenopus laevis TaxID=8355 RepID=CSTOS_XENLA|nr:protein CUSTOS [Xenopus laevis]P0DPK0.1 RecName: Full=Protein CUSTOS [Xenopus laevis]
MAAPRRGTQKSDSDSSDEDLDRFREAAWVPPGAHQKVSDEQNEKIALPSLRVRPDCHEHDGNELQTTPEFRSHVAKKLAAILDSSIREVSQNEAVHISKAGNGDSEDEGFRLFRTSLPGEAGIVTSTIPRRKLASSSSEDSEEEQQRCREAAVSACDILRHSTLQQEPQSTPSNVCDNQPPKKKRKKKKKDRGDTSQINSVEETMHIEPGKNELQAKRKKKKKQKLEMAHCDELGNE